jgi:hypothetical protein
MFERLEQEQFDHILNMLILYKQTHPKKDVYLNQKSILEAFEFMSGKGKDIAEQLGMSTE